MSGQERAERQRQMAEQVLAQHGLPGEKIVACAFANNQPPASKTKQAAGSDIIGAPGAGPYGINNWRAYLVAVTDQRIFFIGLSKKSNYEIVSQDSFRFDEIKILGIRKPLLAWWMKKADVMIPSGQLWLNYFPSKPWSDLDPVLNYIKQQQATAAQSGPT